MLLKNCFRILTHSAPFLGSVILGMIQKAHASYQ
jgi:hypothetical protein